LVLLIACELQRALPASLAADLFIKWFVVINLHAKFHRYLRWRGPLRPRQSTGVGSAESRSNAAAAMRPANASKACRIVVHAS
jgi:hypothetical protein